MKQRIRVIGIVRTAEGVLLLKRPSGRAEELPVWELPTRKIRFGEQPEEAMSRAIYEYLGLEVKEVKLSDVITFAGLSRASQLFNLYIVYEIQLADGKLVPMERYTAYKYLKKEELSAVTLDEATITVLGLLEDKLNPGTVDSKVLSAVTASANTMVGSANAARNAANGATVYVDGGSKGNPGPAAIGYYIVSEDGKVLKRGGEFIGFATSRVAEYYAIKEGCEQAIELGLKRVRFVGDNLMIINQLRGIYRVKNKDLLPIYNDVMNYLQKFEAVAFIHVKREANREADAEANKALEGHFKRKKNVV
ncbi:reverse transcriptase-like protein [Candidatus Saccharibacteria bacterium]|nr:reverse transcriptase-like protein [Candidatus Saccharibacteria bacterium]MBR2658345.1 reverse transcriptase-like protein [Candidatus Saccharibacteria bacterium]